MATRLTGSLTAANTPSIVFTAYESFMLYLKHTTGASTVDLQIDFNDTGTWVTTDQMTTSDVWIVDIPNGGASKFRLSISTLDTGPVGWAVKGKLNANDTIFEGGGDGVSAGSYIIEEAGDDILAEDGTSKLLEENA